MPAKATPYSANAEIVLAKATHVLTVPESAIEFSGDSTFVYIIKAIMSSIAHAEAALQGCQKSKKHPLSF